MCQILDQEDSFVFSIDHPVLMEGEGTHFDSWWRCVCSSIVRLCQIEGRYLRLGATLSRTSVAEGSSLQSRQVIMVRVPGATHVLLVKARSRLRQSCQGRGLKRIRKKGEHRADFDQEMERELINTHFFCPSCRRWQSRRFVDTTFRRTQEGGLFRSPTFPFSVLEEERRSTERRVTWNAPI